MKAPVRGARPNRQDFRFSRHKERTRGNRVRNSLQSQYADFSVRPDGEAPQNGVRPYARIDPGWIAVKRPAMSGLQRKPAEPDCTMPSGTMMIELPAGHMAGKGSLAYAANDAGALNIWLDPQRGLVLRIQQGDCRIDAEIALRDARISGVQRIGFTWDTARGTGWFGLWGAAHGACRVKQCRVDQALSQDLLRRAVLRPVSSGASGALAVRAMPLGTLPGFGPSGVIDTVRGPLPVAELRVGDQVVLSDGDPARVVWAGEMVLPRTQNLRPVVLRAPYWGLVHDLRVAVCQELSLTGEDIAYLFDQPRVRVPISSLGNRSSVRFVGRSPIETYCGVVVDRQGQIIVNGAAFDAPYVGSLLASGGVAGTVLGDMPAPLRQNLSMHRDPAAPMLGPLEVDSLLRFQRD